MANEQDKPQETSGLQMAIDYYKWLIRQRNSGTGTPIARQLAAVIKLAHRVPGTQAVLAANNDLRLERGTNVALSVGDPVKKRLAERREQSAANRVVTGSRQSAALADRLRRKNLRQPELAELNVEMLPGVENAVEVKAGPLTAQEVAQIKDMGAKEIVTMFGEDRINETLVQAGIDPSGSARQRANRLKSILLGK